MLPGGNGAVMTPFWATYFTLLAVFFGACVGSFLNVCIYRIPLGQSVVAPRSHCPNCKKLIAWYDNIPLFSYLILRAKCRNCGIGITPRYFLVELMTAVLFLMVWNRYGYTAAHPQYVLIPIYWLVISGLILGTFVDFEHMILPDRVTIGGMIIGLALSGLAPILQNASSVGQGLLRSAIGLVVGFGSLFAVAEIGKLAFGRKRITFDQQTDVRFEAREKEGPVLHVGDEEPTPWDELFWRASDRWHFECATASLGEKSWTDVTATLNEKGLKIGSETWPVEAVPQFTARIVAYTFPREAMGFGDVKLMGAIGAFFGWMAVPFTIMLSSVIGSLVGIVFILMRKYEWQSRIPYGPYIALACLVWMLGGRDATYEYMALMIGVRQ